MRLSIIIPVFDGAVTLPACLQALRDSRYPAAECFVVNDGSTDDSAAIAKRFGATVLDTGRRCGPAKARNLAARYASGDLLVFLDADVVIQPDTLERMAARFNAEPDLDALIGSYDDCPSDPGFVSQFKNLMHAYVHTHGNPRASTFWSGCGAVKRTTYLEYGGLDESYHRPSVEDIEFGYRLMRSGRKLALDPQIRCKHLKAWTLWTLVRTDVLQRGIPWTELILRTRFLPNDLNLKWSHRASVALSLALMVLATFELRQTGDMNLPAGAGLAGLIAGVASICMLNRDFYRFLAARKGWRFSVSAIPLHIFYFIYSGFAFALGFGIHACRALLPESFIEPVPQPLSESRGEDRP